MFHCKDLERTLLEKVDLFSTKPERKKSLQVFNTGRKHCKALISNEQSSSFLSPCVIFPQCIVVISHSTKVLSHFCAEVYSRGFPVSGVMSRG